MGAVSANGSVVSTGGRLVPSQLLLNVAVLAKSSNPSRAHSDDYCA